MRVTKIPVDIDAIGNIACRESNCLFKQRCANHKSATDYKKEHNFTPDLFEENKVVFCRTRNANMLEDTLHILPEKYNIMGRGALYLNGSGDLAVKEVK